MPCLALDEPDCLDTNNGIPFCQEGMAFSRRWVLGDRSWAQEAMH